MRKITANVYMTLDGRGVFPEYPKSGRPSTETNPLFRHMWHDRFDDVTTVVMGRRSFLGHQRTWSEKALEPGEPEWLLDYRRYLDAWRRSASRTASNPPTGKTRGSCVGISLGS